MSFSPLTKDLLKSQANKSEFTSFWDFETKKENIKAANVFTNKNSNTTSESTLQSKKVTIEDSKKTEKEKKTFADWIGNTLKKQKNEEDALRLSRKKVTVY